MDKKIIILTASCLAVLGLIIAVCTGSQKTTYSNDSEHISQTEADENINTAVDDNVKVPIAGDSEEAVQAPIGGVSDKKGCEVEGCTDVAASGSKYCSFHICLEKGCDEQSVYKHSYCVEHKCKFPDCESRLWYTDGLWEGYCREHAYELAQFLKSIMEAEESSDNAYADDGATERTDDDSREVDEATGNETTKKKPDVEMPDCDDYESYEDFMDDWDGNMPDGSDAEDYWENW